MKKENRQEKKGDWNECYREFFIKRGKRLETWAIKHPAP